MAVWSGAGASLFTTTAGSKAGAGPALTAGDLLVVFVANTGQTGAVTVTDNNPDGLGTYTEVTGGALKATSADLMGVFVRDALITDVTATTITMTRTATTGGGWLAYRVTGMSRAGAAAVLQTGKVQNQAAGTPGPAFPAAALTGNPTGGAVFNATSPATMTPPTGWTEKHDVGYSTPTTGIETATRDSGFTGTTITWGSASASAYCAVIVELDASALPAVHLDGTSAGVATVSGSLYVGKHLSNTFESGTNTATITTANSASPDAFDAVTITSGTATYDSTHARGTLAGKLAVGITQPITLQHSTKIGTLTAGGTYVRAYVYVESGPAAATRIIRVADGGTVKGAINLTAAGKVALVSATGTAATSTNSFPVNQWFRIEAHYVLGVGTGTVEAQLFLTDPDAVSPTETLGPVGSQDVGAQWTTYALQVTIASYTVWFDDIGWDTEGWIGPAPTDKHLTATAAGTSTATADLTVTPGGGAVHLDGTSVGIATATASLHLGHHLTALAAGVATPNTPQLHLGHHLAATSAGTATATGSLTVGGGAVAQHLTGTSAGASTASASLHLGHHISGTSAGASGASASLHLGHHLAGTTAGLASATGALHVGADPVAVHLTGSTAGVATSSGSLHLGHLLAGTAAGMATAQASLLLGKLLEGSAAGTATTMAERLSPIPGVQALQVVVAGPETTWETKQGLPKWVTAGTSAKWVDGEPRP